MPSQSKSRPGAARQRSSQTRRERAAQLRQQQVRQDARRRRSSALSIVAAVAAIIAALVVVKVVAGHNKPKSGTATSAIPASVVHQVNSVPASAFATMGTGDAKAGPKPVSGQPVPTVNGKPVVQYV